MDERNWTDRPLQIDEEVTIGTVQIVHRPAGNATLISGNLESALKNSAPEAPVAGLNQEVGDENFAMRIGRERALLISKDRIDSETVWNSNGYAISPADDCYCRLEISGEGAELLLAQGTSCDLQKPSHSAAILFAGVSALLVRRNTSHHLYIDRAYLTYVSSWLRGASIPDL